MKDKDLRKAQIGLLRFEKTLEETAKTRMRTGVLNKAALLAAYPALLGSAVMAAGKLASDAPLQHAAAIKTALESNTSGANWLLSLAEIVGKGHAVIEGMAVQGAFVILQADGGTPKKDPPQVIASLLGIG